MKMREAMSLADELRDNLVEEHQKAAWLQELDGQLAEMMEREIPEDVWPEDRELLLPAPYAGVYPLYLACKIDFVNAEAELYATDMVLYNAAMDEARAWWRRNHLPKAKRKWVF